MTIYFDLNHPTTVMRSSWDSLIALRDVTAPDDDYIDVHVIYYQGKNSVGAKEVDPTQSRTWLVRRNSLYLGSLDLQPDNFPDYPRENKSWEINPYNPDVLDKNAAISCAVLVSEGARFEAIRLWLENKLSFGLEMRFNAIDPIVTDWSQIIEWKISRKVREEGQVTDQRKSQIKQEVGSSIITIAEHEDFAADLPDGPTKKSIIEFCANAKL